MAEYPMPVSFKLCDFFYHPKLGLMSYWRSSIADTSVWIKCSSTEEPFTFIDNEEDATKVGRKIARSVGLDCWLIDWRWN